MNGTPFCRRNASPGDNGGRCFLLLVLLAGCSVPPGSTPHGTSTREPPPSVVQLFRLMRERLALMHDVARTKWNAQRPVGDPEREQELLQAMEAKGKEHGLDPTFTGAFFAAQIAAARSIQEADFQRWHADNHGPFEDVPALTTLRQRIDSLNSELI